MYTSSILAVAFATLAAAQVTVLPGSDCGSLGPQYAAACSASRAAASAASASATSTILIGSDCASLPPAYQAACYASRAAASSTSTATPVPTGSCDAQRTACNYAPNANHAECAALYYQCINSNPWSNSTTTTVPCYTTTITTVTCNAAKCQPITLTTTVPVVPVTTVVPVVPTTVVTVPVVATTTTAAAATTTSKAVFTGAANVKQVSGALLVGAGVVAALL